MNALPLHVITAALVLIILKVIHVVVHLVTLAFSVKSKYQNAPIRLALIAQCVRTCLAEVLLTAFAALAMRARPVMSHPIRVPDLSLCVRTALNVLRYNKVDSNAVVHQVGLVVDAKITLMIVLKNRVYLVQIVLIWSMIIVAIVLQASPVNDVMKRLIYADQYHVNMVNASTVCSTKNVFVNLVGLANDARPTLTTVRRHRVRILLNA